jgi:hypothetical protein
MSETIDRKQRLLQKKHHHEFAFVIDNLEEWLLVNLFIEFTQLSDGQLQLLIDKLNELRLTSNKLSTPIDKDTTIEIMRFQPQKVETLDDVIETVLSQAAYELFRRRHNT